MDWLERGGVSFRYDLRSGGETTLVLVHEMGGTLESWDLVLPLLKPGIAVLRYDTRGAGLSSKIRGAARIDDMSMDIATLLDATDRRGPVVLAGIAVGGAIAMHFAARHPDRTRGLVPFGPATEVGDDRRALTLARAEAVEGGGMIAIAQAALAQSYPETIRGAGQRFERLRARWLTNDPVSYAAILRMLAGLDMDADLAAISCPTLILAGTEDLVRPPETVRRVAERVRGARFETIASGHFAAIHAPELLADKLNGFFQEIGL